MEIKSITRIDGKIRIVSANSGQERVDDFEDYGLPEVDHLIKSFLEHDVVYQVEESELFGEDTYEFGNCSYVGYSRICISSSLISHKCTFIEKSITTINYGYYLCIINGSSKFTVDCAGYDYYHIFSWETSKNSAKHFNGRHITTQSLEKYAVVVICRILPFRTEVIFEHQSIEFDKSTKLE